MRICVASVPHRADNLVRALPELRGRVLAIDVDYWSRKDLLAIPKLGCPLLGLEVDSASLQLFAAEAAGSPQLMQSICLWMCNHLGVRETLETPRSVVLDELARKEILFLTSCTVDFRSLVRALIAGPKVRPGERRSYMHFDGRLGDVYLTVMRAVAMDPPLLDRLRRAVSQDRDPVQGRPPRRCQRDVNAVEQIKVELREITPCVTRISVRAGDGFLRWDKATAQEILAQTNKIAEDLTGKAG